MKHFVLFLAALAAVAVAFPAVSAGAGYLPAGTEMVELRDDCARHFSNGDGTVRAELGHDWGVDSLRAVAAGRTERWVAVGIVLPVNVPDDIVRIYCIPAPVSRVHCRAWVEWDVSSLPPGSTIEDVRLRLKTCEDSGWFEGDVQFRDVVLRPRVFGHSENGDTALMLYDDCGDGPLYAVVPTPDSFEHWFEYQLNQSARQALRERLSQGWFAVGVNSTLSEEDVFDIDYHGLEQGGSFRPVLVVDYTPTGISESRAAPGLGLRITPNPARGGAAWLRVSGSQGSSVRLTVLDPAGRCLLSRSPGIGAGLSGIPLDLRAFPAGVYLVRVEDGGQSLTGRLLVLE